MTVKYCREFTLIEGDSGAGKSYFISTMSWANCSVCRRELRRRLGNRKEALRPDSAVATRHATRKATGRDGGR